MRPLEELRAEINIELYRQRNGAVADTMRRMSGGNTLINYGVSLPTIRRIAEPYAPSEPLAELLYSSNVRDHRLAALYIADPSRFDAEKCRKWMKEVRTLETADCAAQVLFSKIPNITEIATELLDDENPIIAHTAFMSIFRAASSKKEEIDANRAASLLSIADKFSKRQVQNIDRSTLSALTFAIDTLNRAGHTDKCAVFIDSLPQEAKEELSWLKEI